MAGGFALFVSCVAGSLTVRHGTRTYIGAERRATEPSVVDYHPAEVVAIPDDEWRKYRREYTRALRSGALVERKADAWQLQQTNGARA
jgi:hypothetical protein